MKAASPLSHSIILYGDSMMFEMGLGLGFALGIIAGLQFSRIIWPEYDESVWDRKKRENEIANDAIEKYKKGSNGTSE